MGMTTISTILLYHYINVLFMAFSILFLDVETRVFGPEMAHLHGIWPKLKHVWVSNLLQTNESKLRQHLNMNTMDHHGAKLVAKRLL